MTGGDESSLEQRALAAAEQEREKRKEREAHEEAEQREREEEKARRKAEEEWRVRSAAASTLEKILGHRTSPHDWGIEMVVENRGPSYNPEQVKVEVPWATITLLGVEICGRDHWLWVRGSGKRLTLASFGEAVEKGKRQDQQG